MKATILAAAAVAIASAIVTHASDRVAVYTRIDRVVLAPTTDAPDTIQIWGVFSVGVPKNPNDYQQPARGYLYFALPANRDAARREWADLKSVAGTGQVVAFGSRWEGVPRVRPANEPPAMPDAYSINAGVVKINGRTDYAPIRALIDFNR
jgi:hypothetical protein